MTSTTATPSTTAASDAEPLWSARADVAQRSLTHFFGTEWPQYIENSHPAGTGVPETFNYWWLAHVMDARIDAFERTGDTAWRDQAEETYRNIVERNGGQLFNDYFDDMLWFALAILRLHHATGIDAYRADAVAIWDHVITEGWNDAGGASLAWRKQQLAYKNTPANGPLVILALRLERDVPAADAGDRDFRGFATTAFAWLEDTLVGPDGFVEDGINREGDGRVDTQWRFTYNQGLYIGAAVELARSSGDRAILERATRTARIAIAELSDGSVFRDEGEGGDEGLFKGVFYRYLGALVEALGEPERAEFDDFVRRGTDRLWETAFDGEWLRPANDWSERTDESIPYSTQVSAIMALEQRVRIERRSAAV
ncbi:glycoside hydrolase family 76 protein [Labedella endophytica]|uniref:Glycoside hydrolase n=1 Tax=Labedella endophytica TaxID=1523160 RepID=A0A433JQ52_9MICO|nr:glycoside hydrolase family 76 protein [Labedella endophytica]RUQ98316.1 glycoside hydrolase [Labedella endophytica]